jgi:signal transduction histidine kinase
MLPHRTPSYVRLGLLSALGLLAWGTAAYVALSATPADNLWLSGICIAISGVSFLLLAALGIRELLMNNMIWHVDNRDWRFWLLLLIGYASGIALVDIAQLSVAQGPVVALLVVNMASMAVRFTALYAITLNLTVGIIFGLQFDGDEWWLVMLSCLIQQMVLWSFGQSIVAEVVEVRRLRIMRNELRMAQAQISESGRMLERRNMRHNLHDKMGHELATLHMNLQIIEQHIRRHSAPEVMAAPLNEARGASRRMFVELDNIVTGLKQIPAAHFYDALTDLIDQATTLNVTTHWDDKVSIADPQWCETLLSAVREFLTNVM